MIEHKLRAFLAAPETVPLATRRQMIAALHSNDIEVVGMRPEEADESNGTDENGHHGWSDPNVPRVVTRSIEKSDLVLADLTGHDPDVMYQVGFAHARRKRVLFLIEDDERIPPIIEGRLFLPYDPRDPEQMGERIRLLLNLVGPAPVGTTTRG